MPTAIDADLVTPDLKGTSRNPARDPKTRDKSHVGTMGDKAFMDAIAIVILAWVLILLLAISLRHHNA
jgi:hypothetical protein